MADSILTRAAQAARAAVGVFSNTDQRRQWNLLSGVLPGGLGLPPGRYTRDFLKSYSQMPWLHAVASKVATSCAAAEWKVFVTQKETDAKATRNTKIQRACDPVLRRKMIKELSNRDELKQLDNHPLIDVVNDANAFHTGLQMRKVTQLHMDLAGEAFWLKERDSNLGNIVGVWPIPPDWVINTPTPTNPFFRVQYRSWRGMIPDTEFVWFQDTDPSNPYGRGVGTAQSLGDELETDEYTAKFTKAFFYNRAKPDLLIYPKSGNIREPDIKRLENDWMQSNQGFWRAFKPYFMTREVGIHEMEMNFRSLQLTQLREFERNVILQTFGIPPEILGVLTHSNRATVSAADYFMQRHVVQPRLEFMRTILQEKFIPEFDERLIIDYDTTVEEDKEEQMQLAKTFTWALTMNEQRHMAGQEPIDGPDGEVHLIPQLMTAYASIGDAVTAGAQQHEANIAPPPAPVIAPGLGPKPGAPKPGAPKPAPKPAIPAPKPTAKFNQNHGEHGRFSSGDGGSSGAADEFQASPSDAIDSLARGERVDVAPEDVRAVLAKSAARDDHPDLTDLQVNGMTIFGGEGLGIARADMPQIDDAHRSDFIQSLKSDGTTVKEGSASPLSLHPSQKEISATKVGQMLDRFDSSSKRAPFDPIFVSKDNYVLDGHHRWGAMAALAIDTPKITMPVTRIMLDHGKALAAMAAYDKAHGIASKPTGKDFEIEYPERPVQRWLRL